MDDREVDDGTAASLFGPIVLGRQATNNKASTWVHVTKRTFSLSPQTL